MASDKYRVTGSDHYHDGTFYSEGDIVEDVSESLLRRFPTKFEEIGVESGPEAQSEPEATDDTGSDEPADPDDADGEPGPDPVDEEQAEAKAEATDDEQAEEPDAPSGIPDDHTTLRRIASQNDLGEGVDGRSSSADIVAALEQVPEDDRERILNDTELDSEG